MNPTLSRALRPVRRPGPGGARPLRPPARRTLSRWLLLAVAGLTFSPTGSTLAADPVALDTVGPAATDVPGSALEQELERLREENGDLAAEVGDLTDERDRLRAALTDLTDLYAPMDADRLLLFELRKELPTTRVEADAYLERLERLALASDPVRLATIATRVRETAPGYLDWRDTTFATQEEAAAAFASSGAAGFQAAFTEFRNAIMLTVANRLDTLLSRIDIAR